MPVMSDLKNKLHELAEYFQPGDRVIYLDIPVHTNVGDLLINLGTENFFLEHGIHVSRRYALDDIPKNIPELDEHTILVFHGGGNFGDLWEPHHATRERLIAQYRTTRCIIMPQTVHFRSLQAQEKSLRLLTEHPRLQVLARDHLSLQKLIDGGLKTARVMPDMAHSLYGVLKRDRVHAVGTMEMIRRDREAAHGKSTAAFGNAIDWSDIVPYYCRALRYGINRMTQVDRMLGLPVNHTTLFYPIRDRALRKAVSTFSRFEQVVTDRLHGTILSLLLGIPVKAIDNSYGKLSTYCATWLKGCPGLECAWSKGDQLPDCQRRVKSSV